MRWSIILLGVVLIAACGGSTAGTTATTPDTSNPGAVHTAWVEALRGGTRDQAAAAVAPVTRAVQANVADDTVQRMQAIIRDQRNGTFTYGALETVDTQPVTTHGQQATGVSIWHFQQMTVCYQTDLVESDGRWGVMAWHQQPACTGATS